MNNMNFKRVVITGGAGFIGSNYIYHVLETHPDWDLIVLDKLTYAGNIANLAPIMDRITFFECDIANIDDVRNHLSGTDAVVNFAAESHVDRSLIDPIPFVRTNVLGTTVLLNEALNAGVKRFLHVSTDEVYGDLIDTDGHSLESDILHPRSPYAASKAGAEHIVFSYGISHGLDVVVTRGSNTYGPYQYPEKIIPLFITNILQNIPLPVYGDGSALRDYMHVEDHASGIDIVLHQGKGGQAYNLGAKEQVSGIDLANRLLDFMEKPSDLISFVADRQGHDYRYSVDPTKAENLGWRRKWSFNTGLSATVRWYLDNMQWWLDVKDKLCSS